MPKTDPEVEAAREELRAIFPPGSEVPIVMAGSHAIVLCVAHRPEYDPTPGRPFVRNITHLVARAVPGWKVSRKTGGISMAGAPTRYAFHLTYTLGHALYPQGFTVNQASGCRGRNGAKDGARDPDGGYALRGRDL
ncbi:hypothetical protein [Planktothrix phage Pra-JY27]|nr:hypothetical protein [Planktothrix phage Pag-Yong1]WEV89266.1 hypothetical protein [Synechococcus phage MinM2]